MLPNFQDGQPYPDCLWDDNVVAVFDSGSQSEHLVSILTILNWVSCGIAIFVAAKIAFFLLAKRMVNESKATRRMNKKFNQRTILQVSNLRPHVLSGCPIMVWSTKNAGFFWPYEICWKFCVAIPAFIVDHTVCYGTAWHHVCGLKIVFLSVCLSRKPTDFRLKH